MTKKKNPEKLPGCMYCGHYALSEESVRVDLMGDTVEATARYYCKLGLVPDWIGCCDEFYNAVIEDMITWTRQMDEEDKDGEHT